MAFLARALTVCSSGVLLYMVPFCLVGLSINLFVRTLFTIYPSYNLPVSINLSASLPHLNPVHQRVHLEMDVTPSVFCTLNIWICLSLVSVVLTLSMPFGASYKAFSEVGLYKKLTVLTSGVVALLLELLVFIIVYQMYAVGSFLQLILCVPLLTFIFYSSFQGYILLLDCSHAFTKFHIALRILFNYVTIQHGFCIIAISYYKPNSMSFILSNIGLLYRIWVAIKYTDFLKNYFHATPLSSGPNDDRDSDLTVTRKNPSDYFYQDHDTEAYKPEEPKEERAYSQFKNCIVINVSLFYNFWKKLTYIQTINLLLAFNVTLLYTTIFYLLFICYCFMFRDFYFFNTLAAFIPGINVTLSIV